MKSLFSRVGSEWIEALTYTDTLYAFDYDGTLCPIVRNPELAHLSRLTESLLGELSTIANVAILSGRGVNDLRDKIKIPSIQLVGNHGLEGVNSSTKQLEESRLRTRQWIEQLKHNSFLSGVQIENKLYSLAIHFRQCRNKKMARQQIQDQISLLNPTPRTVTGKSVINLVSHSAPHKGIALQELMRLNQFKAALYIGDDDTDEDVFGIDDERILTVRVGFKKSSQAAFFIQRQGQMNAILKSIIRNLKRR